MGNTATTTTASAPSGFGSVSRFIDTVRRRLGYGDDALATGVDVELTSDDYTNCMESALNLLNRYKPREGRRVVPNAASAVNRYPITDIPGLIDIIEVSFLPNNATAAVPDPFDPLLNGVMGVQNYDTEGSNTYLRYQMAYTDAQIIFGQSPDWNTQWGVNPDGTEVYVLYLFLPPAINYTVGYKFQWGITPDDNALTGLAHIERTMRDWFYDYGTACAKEIVGRKRIKFGGVTSPEDGVSETDGAELVATGAADRERLEQDIISRRKPSLPFVG